MPDIIAVGQQKPDQYEQVITGPQATPKPLPRLELPLPTSVQEQLDNEQHSEPEAPSVPVVDVTVATDPLHDDSGSDADVVPAPAAPADPVG